MTIQPLGYVTFKTHQVYISKDTDSQHIHCFKATNNRCDMQTFTSEDAACDYILAPFDTIVYELVIPEVNQTE